jgi:hypothetical protein
MCTFVNTVIRSLIVTSHKQHKNGLPGMITNNDKNSNSKCEYNAGVMSVKWNSFCVRFFIVILVSFGIFIC